MTRPEDLKSIFGFQLSYIEACQKVTGMRGRFLLNMIVRELDPDRTFGNVVSSSPLPSRCSAAFVFLQQQMTLPSLKSPDLQCVLACCNSGAGPAGLATHLAAPSAASRSSCAVPSETGFLNRSLAGTAQASCWFAAIRHPETKFGFGRAPKLRSAHRPSA